MSSKDEGSEEGCSIYLGGLPFDSDEGAIKKVFEEFGEVLSAKVRPSNTSEAQDVFLLVEA